MLSNAHILGLAKDENEWNDPEKEKSKYVENPLINTSFFLPKIPHGLAWV